MASWSKELTARIGREVKRLREEGGEKKLSAQWLADRTAELGHPIPRTTISETEQGKRSTITLQEVLVLAAALEVPPIQLLYPDIPDGKVEMLPGQTKTSWWAAQGFSGELERGTLTGLARQRDTARRNLKLIRVELRYNSEKLSTDQVDRLTGQLDHYQQRLGDIDDQIRAAGGVVEDER